MAKKESRPVKTLSGLREYIYGMLSLGSAK